MDDRAQIAAMCLQGLLSSAAAFCETPEELPNEELVPLAVAIADELLAALKRIPPSADEPDPAPPLAGPGNGEAGEPKGAASAHAEQGLASAESGAHRIDPPTVSNLTSPVSLWDCEVDRYQGDPPCPGPIVYDPESKARLCAVHMAAVPSVRAEWHRRNKDRNAPAAPVERLAG